MMNHTPEPLLDCLVIGAHPDDAEVFAGGTMALAVRLGHTVGVVDLTRGESASRGTPELRAKEASEASRILGLAQRQTLDLGDSEILNTKANRIILVEVIRRLKPRLILTHGPEDRHPDHRHTHELVRDAAFLANVGGFPAEGDRWPVEGMGFFPGNIFKPDQPVDWVVDVSETLETKFEALRAYASQFLRDEEDDGPATYISGHDFWKNFERRAALWGHRIGVAHGEPYMLDHPSHASHPLVELCLPRRASGE